MGVANNSSSDDCLPLVEIATVNLVSIVGQAAVALLILCLLSFTQKRRKLCPGCLWGFPGLPVPMDFLVTPRYRFVYTVIFGIMATALLQVFQTFTISGDEDFFLRTFYKVLIQPLILVITLSLSYFPLFACVRPPRPLLGRVLGFIYSIIWFSRFVMVAVIQYTPSLCDPVAHPPHPTKIVTDVLSDVPIVIGALIIVVWYLFKMVGGVVKACRRASGRVTMEEMTDSGEVFDEGAGHYHRLATPIGSHALGVKRYHIHHVRTLLTRPPTDTGGSTRAQRVLRRLPYTQGFRFPLPFLGAVVAMSMLLYQLTIQVVVNGISLTTSLPVFAKRDLYPLLDNLSVLTNHSLFVSEVKDIIGIVFIGLPVLLSISPVISFIICLLLLIHMVLSVSKECKQLAREGFKVPLPSPASRVPSSWKYIGYQIGFFALAYTLYTALVMLVGLVCCALYMGFRFIPRTTAGILIYILVPVGWSQLIFFSQSVICRFVFFSGDRKGKFIAITNSRLFNWFSFLLFFYNGFAGFISAILRTILASLFTLLLLFRLDRVVMMKGFERFDFGHKAYLGFMYLDYTYNNAVVHVFLGVVRKSVRDRLGASAKSLTSDEEGVEQVARVYYTNVQARNRWLVAYTLIRNPSLLPQTASNLARSPDQGGEGVQLVSMTTAAKPKTDELATLVENEQSTSVNW